MKPDWDKCTMCGLCCTNIAPLVHIDPLVESMVW